MNRVFKIKEKDTDIVLEIYLSSASLGFINKRMEFLKSNRCKKICYVTDHMMFDELQFCQYIYREELSAALYKEVLSTIDLTRRYVTDDAESIKEYSIGKLIDKLIMAKNNGCDDMVEFDEYGVHLFKTRLENDHEYYSRLGIAFEHRLEEVRKENDKKDIESQIKQKEMELEELRKKLKK